MPVTTWTVGGRTWVLDRVAVEANYYAELSELRRARKGQLTPAERALYGLTEEDLLAGVPRLEASVARMAALLRCIDAGVEEVTDTTLREVGGFGVVPTQPLQPTGDRGMR